MPRWLRGVGVLRSRRKKIRKTFPTLDAARAWRADTLGGVKRGSVRAPRPTTVRQAAEQLLTGMRDGSVRTRSGDVYKPSVVRAYEASLRYMSCQSSEDGSSRTSNVATCSASPTTFSLSEERRRRSETR